MDLELRARRHDVEAQWARMSDPAARPGTRREVAASWRRSARHVPAGIGAAPVQGPEEVAARWLDSRLGRAGRIILDDLDDLAASGDLVAALTDERITIAWMAAGRTMGRRAEQVAFSVGGCWAEDAVGTNALALAGLGSRPATVFSAEHYAPMVHDWVCYSAPILDPASGRVLGVLDVSTTWDRAHPSLLTTVRALARCVEHELAADLDRPSAAPPGGSPARTGLVLRTLGTAGVEVDGRPVPLGLRPIELLTVLSLHPGGLTLDELVARVYGDRPVSPSTVKAELSHLRHALGGRIGSRPYRLVGPVAADHLRLLDAVGRGDLATAVAAYGGSMLTRSESPDVVAWRHHIDVSLRDAVLRDGDPDLLWALGGRLAEDRAIHRATLASLGPADRRASLVAGRLAALDG